MVISEEEKYYSKQPILSQKIKQSLALLIGNEFLVSFSFELNLARLLADITKPLSFSFVCFFIVKYYFWKNIVPGCSVFWALIMHKFTSSA